MDDRTDSSPDDMQQVNEQTDLAHSSFSSCPPPSIHPSPSQIPVRPITPSTHHISHAESIFSSNPSRGTPATSLCEKDFVSQISEDIENKVDSLERDELYRLQNALQRALIQADSIIQRTSITNSEDSAMDNGFRCLLCASGKQTVFEDQGILRHHLMDEHFLRYLYCCPTCSQALSRKDKLHRHTRLSHNLPRLSDEEMSAATIENPPLKHCPICANVQGTWDEFFQCLIDHCSDRPARRKSKPNVGYHDLNRIPPYSYSLIGTQQIYEFAKADTSQQPSRTGFSCIQLSSTTDAKYRTIQQTNNSASKRVSSHLHQRMSRSPSADAIVSAGSTSELSSTTTRITTPETDEDLSIDSGMSTAENLDCILDPISHNDNLRALETDTIRLCGLEKVDPRSALSEATISIGKCLYILKDCRNAFRHLRDEGFCGSILTVLTENPNQQGIARGVHITLEEIDGLVYQLWANKCLEPDSSSVQLVQELVSRFLHHRIDEDVPTFSSGLSFLCRALSLGIVSFAGSHACPFDISSWGHEMTIISVGLGYSFARQQLACLDAFVGGPVWVLGPTRRPLNVSGLMVSLTLRDLQQLWGPVWLVGGTEDAAPAIRTERGFIIPVSRNKQKTSQPKDIICHWTRDLPDSFLREKLPEDRIFIDTESKLIIGLGESEHTMGITVNKQCQADINLIQQQIEYELKLPGTCEAHYVGEGYEVNLTGGYQVNVGLTKKFKRMPARTHKSALIAYCTSPNAQLLPVLKLMVGLEVSACTGNSRRVSLWDVIQLTRVKEKAEGFGYIQAFCDHPAGSIECIGMCWAQDRGQIDEIVDIPGDETFKKAAARRELINAILALEHTGINHKGVLQAFWPFSECPQVCCIGPSTRVRKNNWLRVVKDTPDTSTFAALSQRCLGMAYSFSIVPLSGCFQQYIPQPLPTALCTRVFIKDPNGEFVHEMTHGNHLRIGELKLDAVIMQPGDPHVVVARVRQARLSSWVGNGIKVQEHVSRHNPVSRLVLVITF